MEQVKACPRCGRIVLWHCWHPDVEEVYSILMDTDKAKELRLAEYHYLIDLAESLLEEGDLD